MKTKLLFFFVIAAVSIEAAAGINICPTCDYWISCASESMGTALNCRETYKAETVHVVNTFKLDNVEIGDIIWFKIPPFIKYNISDDRIKLIAHRVINTTEEDGVLHYITKGDANNFPDSYNPSIFEVEMVMKNGNNRQ